MAERKLRHRPRLARVEGEGALHVRLRDGRVRRRARCASTSRRASSRRFLRGRALHRGPRHHRADLRDLPGRLPDELDRGDGGRVRRRGARADPRAAPAPVLRRVDREPRAARVHAPRARLPRLRERVRDGARPPRDRRAGAALKKAGNALMRVVGGREIHPVNVRVGGFYRAPRARELRGAASTSSSARASSRARPSPGRRRCRARSFEEDFEFVALSRPDAYAIEGGRLDLRAAAWTSRPREYEEHFVEEQVPHSTALHSHLRDGAALTWSARWRATRCNRDTLVAGRARGGRRGRARPGRAATRSAASSCAASRSCTRSTRRCALIAAYEPPDPPAVDVAPRAGRRLRLERGAARHCSGTATRSTTTARSSTRGSSRRRRRTRRASSRPARLRRAQPRPGRRRAAARAASRRAQLRPVHLVRDALPAPGGRPRVTLVIGVGNPLARRRRRGPRGRAPRGGARRRVRPRGRLRRAARRCGRAPRDVVVVDAARSGAAPGHRPPLRRRRRAAPARARCAPPRHAFGVADADRAGARARPPARALHVYAIEGEGFGAGAALTPAVAAAAASLAERLAGDVP